MTVHIRNRNISFLFLRKDFFLNSIRNASCNSEKAPDRVQLYAVPGPEKYGGRPTDPERGAGQQTATPYLCSLSLRSSQGTGAIESQP